MKKFFVILSISILASCSGKLSKSEQILRTLDNRGPIPLSPDNAYLASNLLVSKEMDLSPELKGFIESRGAPDALEVNSTFISGRRLNFYYPDNREFYTLDHKEQTWVISGPFALNGSQLKGINSAIRSEKSKNPKTQNALLLDNNASTETKSLDLSSAKIPKESLILKPKQSVKNFKQPNFYEDQSDQKASADLGKLIDQEDISLALKTLRSASLNKPAEQTQAGDIIHQVTFSGQSLKLVALWYTDESSNSSKIARINGLPESAPLTSGTRVTIPRYLVKHRGTLTEQAEDRLETLMGAKAGSAGAMSLSFQ